MKKTTNTLRTKSLLVALVFGLYLLVGCNGKPKKTLPKDLMVIEQLTEKAISKSWNLLQEGQQMADEGKSFAEIIETLPDSTLVQTNASSILFLVKGSMPMLIELPQQEDNKGIKKGSNLASRTMALLNTGTINFNSLLEENKEVDIVASQKGEDKRQDKKALILSPYIKMFGANDDGVIAKKFLETNKNYKDNIAFKSNKLSLADYQNFHEYDLVHLSTHGRRFCNAVVFANGSEIEIISGGDSNFCRIIINSGIKHNFTKKEDVNKFLSDNPEYKDLILISTKTIFLRSSFFTHFYGNGLEDKIWVFSTCQLGQRSDFKEAIQGIHKNGHFYYWLNSVYAQDAKAAYGKFYKNLVTEGLDARKSFEKIPLNLRSNLPINLNDSIESTTELHHLQTGLPRHGIEIIEMWHPEDKIPVTEGVFYPLVGDFGDGMDETLTLKVQLKGYTKAEFEEQQMGLSLKVDDKTVLNNQTFLPTTDDAIEVEDLENHEYGVEVTINDIPVPDVGDKDKITLAAYLHLNEENFSVHKERVTIKADGVKATIVGAGNRMVLTFDDKRRAQKIESPQMPSEAYTDEYGYMYIHTPEQGWVKMNLNNFMGKAMLQLPTNAALNNMMENMAGNNNLFFPITEWGIRFRKTAFERNANFRKQLVDCGKVEKCTKYIGIAGQEAGVTALFEPGGRLKELNFNGTVTTYEYGEYTVILPDAKEIGFGI